MHKQAVQLQTCHVFGMGTEQQLPSLKLFDSNELRMSGDALCLHSTEAEGPGDESESKQRQTTTASGQPVTGK